MKYSPQVNAYGLGSNITGSSPDGNANGRWGFSGMDRSWPRQAQEEVNSAEEDHRLFKTRYEVGKSIALEQFDAAVKMFQARLTLKESIYKYLLAQHT